MRHAAPIVFLWVAACSSTSPAGALDAAPQPVDATSSGDRDAGAASDAQGHPDATGSLLVTAGTGRDRFEPLTDGQRVELTIGPQGGGRSFGYHIWSGAKMIGGAPMGAMVEVKILDGVSRELRAREGRITSLMPDGDGYVIYGMAPRITDCCLVAGREVILRAEVQDRDGKAGSGEVRVVAGKCIDRDGSDLCL